MRAGRVAHGEVFTNVLSSESRGGWRRFAGIDDDRQLENFFALAVL
jgi:hypothetical protein